MRSFRPTLVDVLVAAPFLVVGQLAAWDVFADGGARLQGSHAVNAVIAAAVDGLVLLRRRAPLVALVAMLPLGIAQTAYGEASTFVSGFVPVVVIVAAIAAREPRRTSIAATAYALAGLVAIILIAPDLQLTNELPFSGPILVVAWGIGRALRARDQRARSAESHAASLEATSARVLEEERARIARELHDVIAHSVSVMVVQAGAARTQLNGDGGPVRDALLAIEQSGRQALEEMRRLLGMLRQDQREAELLPQPGLGSVAALIEQVRATGLDVGLTVEGAAEPLPPGIDLSAYRILQEALTNTVKHAHASRATVRLTYRPSWVDLEVEDDGSGGAAAPGDGHGLVGMRERVELYGGTFAAGPCDGRGFRVHAALPLDAA
jgi:signal transduction histidine kinase